MNVTVQTYMSPHPHTIGAAQTMAAAHEVMRSYRIRHLPVLEGGVLVGVVSERDLHLVETLKDVDPQKVRVDDAMTTDPYTVALDTQVSDVVTAMIDQRLGSAVVMDEGHVVGVFTTIDALRALRDLMGTTTSE